MKLLVTGATGLLGNNLTRALLERGHAVTGLTRSAAKAQWMFREGPEPQWIEGDMSKIEAWAHALEGMDGVAHTAAYFREYYQLGADPETLERVNVDATLELMSRAHAAGVSRFVHVGSSAAIGDKDDGSPGDEDTPPAPRRLANLYARSKAEGAERVHAAAEGLSGMRLTEVLPGWMWGPGDAGPTAAGQLALDLLAGRIPALPRGAINLVDARDVAAAMVAILEGTPAHARYILGGPQVPVEDIVHGIAEHAPMKTPPFVPGFVALNVARGSELWARLTRSVPAVPLEGVRFFTDPIFVSSERARAELGFSPRPLSETLEATVSWLKSRGTYVAPAAEPIPALG